MLFRSHWPAIVLVRQWSGKDSLGRDLLVCAITLGISAISFRYVESPFRSGRTILRASRPGHVLALGATALVLTVTCTTLLINQYVSSAPPTGSTAVPPLSSPEVEPGAPTTTWPPDVDWSDPARLEQLQGSRSPLSLDCAKPEPPRVFDPSCVVIEGTPTVVLIGDSHAAHLAPAVASIAKIGRAHV